MIRFFLFIVILITSTPAYSIDKEDLKCLSDNLYYEARGESVKGQVKVIETVLNRVEDSRWPNTICEVIYQKSQFSWTINPYTIDDDESYKFGEDVIKAVLKSPRLPEGPNHYLRCDWRDKVDWWENMILTDQIDNHCFYNN